VADSVSWLRPRWEHLVNAALAGGGSTERVDHRSHKARGIARHPTVHTGKKSVSARARTGLNVRLRSKNAKAAELEEQISKLMRMRARLAARVAMEVADQPADDIGAPSTTHQSRADRHSSRAAEDILADLSPWRRREVLRLGSQSSVKPGLNGFDGSNPEASSDGGPGGRLRRVLGRSRR
jgi:hypothetical protein